MRRQADGRVPLAEIDGASCAALHSHATAQRSVAAVSPASREFLAAANLLLVQARLRDDVEDDRKWRSRIGLWLVATPARRAASALANAGFATTELHSLPARQAAVEQDSKATLEDLARPSATLTGQLFAHAGRITRANGSVSALTRVGNAIGAYVYVEDALRDRLADRIRRRFNAIDHCFGLADGAHQARSFQRDQTTTMRAELARLDLASQGRVLLHLVDSLDAQLNRNHAPRAAEAGDCCSGGCDDASGCDGCGDSGCCAADCCSPGSARQDEEAKKEETNNGNETLQ